MNIAVVGSRDWSNYYLVKSCLKKLLIRYGAFTVITGTYAPKNATYEDVRGADQCACLYAKDNDLPLIVHEADWRKLGPGAGPYRNTLIVDDAEMVIAFWDERSRGTLDTLTKALTKNVPAWIVTPQGVHYRYEIETATL